MNQSGARPQKLKKAWLAFLLSLALPGAGLAYLGKWPSALGNFAAALIVVGTVVATMPPSIIESIHYLYLAIGVGSGAWAHAAATQHNERNF